MLTHKDWEDWAYNRGLWDPSNIINRKLEEWRLFLCWSGISRQITEFLVNGRHPNPREQALVQLYRQFWKHASSEPNALLPPFESLYNSSETTFVKQLVETYGLALIHPSHLEHDWVVDYMVCRINAY